MGAHLGPVADVFGAVRVVKCGQRLLLALHGGCDGGNHTGLGAAAQ